MSDKTTEEAAEEYLPIPCEKCSYYNCHDIQCIIKTAADLEVGNKIKPDTFLGGRYREYFVKGANYMLPTIAQLSEENERYRKCLEFIKQEAYASEPYLYSPDVLAFIEKALTPKPPKIKG